MTDPRKYVRLLCIASFSDDANERGLYEVMNLSIFSFVSLVVLELIFLKPLMLH